MSAGTWALVFGSSSSVSFAGATLTGTCTVNGVEIGFRTIPQTVKNSNYTLTASESGNALVHNDTSSYTYTVNSGVFAAGQVVTLVNDTASGAIAIAAGPGVSLFLTGTATNGNRTLAARGIATIVFVSASVAYVSGPGVT